VPVEHLDSYVAADDSNRIVAVSPSATALLGYDHPADLVGHRLLDIIPPRYHQAHLAGFTLHLTNGRSPLLARPVTVPALRRDGSEVVVRLHVKAHQTAAGHRAFTATLTPAEPQQDDPADREA
jgi:PAS domain S-box-containing protein